LISHTKQVDSLAISPDSRWLATAGDDGTVHVYDLTHNDPVASALQFPGYEEDIEGMVSLDFSPDSRWLASGSEDRTARLYDMSTADPAADPTILRGHLRAILSVDFSPDGHWLATGGNEGIVFLWDMTSPNPAGNPRRLPGKNAMREVAFSPDSKTLATANQDGVVRLWLPDTQDLINLACQTSGRNLTLAEWQQVLPDQPYRNTCPQWPEGR
jgi:WD40 repeat protein